PRLDPTLSLLMNRVPRRQVVGNHSPRTSGADHVAHRIEEPSNRVFALWRILFHQGQIGGAKLPLLIANIALVTGFCASGFEYFLCHPKLIAWLYLHCTALFSRNCMTGSKRKML